MPASLLVSRTIHPGEETVIDVTSGMYSVVFKDNGETGYVYAMDNGRPAPVLDALHLYNVDQFEVKHSNRTADIEIWASEDGLGTLVKLNGRDEAYFDFADRRAVCRSCFPRASGGYAVSHDWDETALHRMHPQRRTTVASKTKATTKAKDSKK